jgi:hypothetical protein
MPFSQLTNFRLGLEFQIARVKYTDMLENNDFQMHLMENITEDIANTFDCRYYDDDSFNLMIKKLDSGLSLLHINLQSSFAKFGLLKAHLQNFNKRFDIIAISETGRNNLDYCSHLFEGYTFYYDAPISAKGGAGLYIRDGSATVHRRFDLQLNCPLFIENIWLEIEAKENSYIIGAIYRHPGKSTEPFMESMISTIDKLKGGNKPYIICGDINIDLLKPHRNESVSYIDLLLTNNIIPCITLPTRITDYSATLIDHINIFRPRKRLGNKVISGNLFCDISDHLPNFVIFSGTKIQPQERPVVRNFSERNIGKFKTALAKIDWSNLYEEQHVNEAYHLFITKYTSLYNECFPRRRISRKRVKNKKWLTKGLLISIRYKNKLYKKYLTRPNEVNKAAYVHYKNKLLTILRKAEKEYYTKLLLDDKNSIGQIWKVYSQVLGTAKQKKSLKLSKLVVNNESITGDSNIANAFNGYFANIGTELSLKYPHNDNYKRYLTHNNLNNMFLSPVTIQEVINEINRLLPHKAPGYDDVAPRVLKKTCDNVVEPLTHIYNLSFRTATVPSDLKVSKVIPIYKKKEIFLPGNYRPISLLSIFNKILERLMYRRLYTFLHKYDILFKYQFGFREKYSTILALIEIIDNTREELDNGNNVLGIYLDLSKAFDTVNHDILFCKLDHYGVRGHVLQWFQSYLQGRQQLTYVNKSYSSLENVHVGVPQGSVLGPLLFLIYINDISKCIPPEKLRLFADDTNVFISGNNFNDIIDEADETLTKLYEWFSCNKLTLNVDKTCYTIFTNRVRPQRNVKLNGTNITYVSSAKYLGVYLDENLTWTDHINFISNKLIKLSSALYYLSSFINMSHVRQIYFSYIFPYVKYGIEIYGRCPNYNMKRIQITQNRLLKILCHRKKTDSATALHQELKLLTIVQIRDLFTSIFVYKQQNNLLPNIFASYYKRNDELCLRTTRQSENIHLPKYRTSIGQNALKYRGAKLWNSLPENVKSSKSAAIFKKSCKIYLMNNHL